MKHSAIQSSRRKSGSCLGDTAKLFGLLVLGSIVYLLVVGAFAPWSYFLGGNFHLIPIWQGWGKLQADSGDFTLYVLLSQPQTNRLGYPNLSGTAVLCTPRGEQFTSMRVIVLFQNKKFGLDSNNQPVTLQIHTYRPFSSLKTDFRPEFNLYGTWQNPNLVLEDHGSLASAFLSDGQAYLGPESDQPPAGKNLSITLVPGNITQFRSACQTGH